LNIARKFDVVPANLNAPITRNKFFTWMKQFVENTTVKTVLEGKWMLKNVELEKGKPTELKDVTLTFTGHKVHAKICNNINGEFTLTPDTIKTTDLISTLMACQDEKIMSAEKNFELNNAKFMLSDDEKTLEITTARGIKYTFQKA
jgi:META domain